MPFDLFAVRCSLDFLALAHSARRRAQALKDGTATSTKVKREAVSHRNPTSPSVLTVEIGLAIAFHRRYTRAITLLLVRSRPSLAHVPPPRERWCPSWPLPRPPWTSTRTPTQTRCGSSREGTYPTWVACVFLVSIHIRIHRAGCVRQARARRCQGRRCDLARRRRSDLCSFGYACCCH